MDEPRSDTALSVVDQAKRNMSEVEHNLHDSASSNKHSKGDTAASYAQKATSTLSQLAWTMMLLQRGLRLWRVHCRQRSTAKLIIIQSIHSVLPLW
jgi:PleD family two-component response regulator